MKTIQDIAIEILRVVQDLEEADDAREYARLYLLSMRTAGWNGDSEAVLAVVRETDKRIQLTEVVQ